MQINFLQMKHVSEEELSLHALNDLPESRRGQVADHLSSCRHCRAEYHEVREFINIFRLAAKAPVFAARPVQF